MAGARCLEPDRSLRFVQRVMPNRLSMYPPQAERHKRDGTQRMVRRWQGALVPLYFEALWEHVKAERRTRRWGAVKLAN